MRRLVCGIGVIGAVAASFCFAASAYAEALVVEPGTVISTAVENGDGKGNDYEFIVTMKGVDEKGFTFDWSMGAPKNFHGARRILSQDMDSAARLNNWYSNNEHSAVPKTGAVSLFLPRKAFARLKAGEAVSFDVTEVGKRTYRAAGSEPFSVLINGKPETLTALVVMDEAKRRSLFLDDAHWPLGLFSKDKWGARVVAISTRREAEGIVEALRSVGRWTAYGVHFNTASEEILPASEPTLSAVAAFLREDKKTGIRVEGHTDGVGTDKDNRELSRRRAESVKRYLVEKGGVDDARIGTAFFGESRPLGDNKTLEGRAVNRRVEFVVVKR